MSTPLTDYEKAQVLFYLGYSVFEDDGPAVRSLNSLSSKPLAPDFIRPIIQKLEQIDADLHAVRPIAKAIKVGADEVRAHYTYAVLAKLGRAQVGRLATFTKISICSDVFSNGAATQPETFYSGDPSQRMVGKLG